MKNDSILKYILDNYNEKTEYNKERVDPYIASIDQIINCLGTNQKNITVTPFFNLLLNEKYDKCDILLKFDPEILNNVVSNIQINLFNQKKKYFINALSGLLLVNNVDPDDKRVKYLIDRGLNLNQETGYIYKPLKDGLYSNKIELKICPALFIAVYMNNIKMIQYLLNQGLKFDNTVDKFSIIISYIF